MPANTPNNAEIIALSALAATLGKPNLSHRFLDLTGIETDELRRKAGEPSLLAALIRFLEAHEPDLVAIAGEIGIEPAKLVACRQILEGQEEQ